MIHQKSNLYKLLPLVILAVLVNSATIIYFTFTDPLPSAPTIAELIPKIIWLPVMWLTSIVTAIVVTIKKRKTLFQRAAVKWTIPVILLCTPIPLAVGNELVNQNAFTEAETEHIRGPGYVIRREKWVYAHGGALAVTKFFRLNRDDNDDTLDPLYKEDSTWTYFDKKGDVLKTEKYKDGKLIETAKN
jgi:hypothetical protein